MKPTGYWTLERCKSDALKYHSKKEWGQFSISAYSKARKMKWIDLCCSHMIKLGSKYKRLIYAFEFPDKSVYVGLTCNSQDRKNEHLYSKKKRKTTVYQYIKKTQLNPTYKELTEYLEDHIASIKEGEFLEKYRSDGWKILNKNKTGGLGGNFRIWTKEKCLQNALKYKTKTEWLKNNPGAYDAAHRNKWLIECCKHMPRRAKFFPTK